MATSWHVPWHCHGLALGFHGNAIGFHATGVMTVTLSWHCHEILSAMRHSMSLTTVALPLPCYGIPVAIPWHPYGTEALSWQSMTVPWQGHSCTMKSHKAHGRASAVHERLWQCHANAMKALWQDHGIGRYCKRLAPWQGYGRAMDAHSNRMALSLSVIVAIAMKP